MADWDVVVIGGGAAGLSAAAAVAEAGRACLVIDRMGGGGELMNLGPLQDGTGSPSGPELAARLLEEAVAAGAELGVAEVTGLAQTGDIWRISTDDASHTARAVILAVGLAPGTLGLADEARFEGQGLSHCAACDGPLYAGQPVVVAGADKWAVADARELTAVASAVFLVTQGAPSPPQEGLTVLPGRIVALDGTTGLEAVAVQLDGGAVVRQAAGAVFVQGGRRPGLGFAPEDVRRDAEGRLITDDRLRCSLPGLFAAGDARAGAPRTLASAMADGRAAAVSVQA